MCRYNAASLVNVSSQVLHINQLKTAELVVKREQDREDTSYLSGSSQETETWWSFEEGNFHKRITH